MSLNLQLEVAIELVLAALLGMVIGMDRERRDRSAGLRTHMLVTVGACLFTTLSAHAFPAGDPTRVASNIVTGIGFLGAGTIVQRKHGVQNLTTAASIWSTAAVGMAVGLGAWFLAICAVLLIWIILAVLHGLEIRNPDKESQQHELEELESGLADSPDDKRMQTNLPK